MHWSYCLAVEKVVLPTYDRERFPICYALNSKIMCSIYKGTRVHCPIFMILGDRVFAEGLGATLLDAGSMWKDHAINEASEKVLVWLMKPRK